MRLLFILILFTCLKSQQAWAQQAIITQWDSLEQSATLPEELLTGKALLVLKTLPNQKNTELRGPWMPFADELQPHLQKSGIDAVAAYHIDDIASGKETSETYLYLFDERQITHLVLAEQNSAGWIIRLAAFNKQTLIDAEVPVWSTSAPELRLAGNQLYLAASQSGQKFTNRLILAVPEKGQLVTPIRGRRSEFYDLNLKSEQLAVLPFTDTASVRSVMADYPYRYDFVDPSISERELRSDGYQFILYFVHSTGESVREMLEYPIDASENAYVSETFEGETPVAFTYDKNRPVYKFYIKHIYSGNVFLGQKYDAAPTWEEALRFYISNLREQLL